jgi:hypothetical protein
MLFYPIAAQTETDLYAFPGVDQQIYPLVKNSGHSIDAVIFYKWDASSTATDDGYNVLKPTSTTGSGRYLLYPYNQIQSDWAATSGYAEILNKPVKSYSIVSHSLNSSFQVSTTREAYVAYSVQLSVGLGQTGTISLQISSDNVSWSTVGEFTFANTLTLALGNETAAGQLCAIIPLAYYVRLESSGTATPSYLTGQEVLL